MIPWLDPRRPLNRLWYLFYGVLLSGLKYACDLGVSQLFGKTFSPLLYASPPDAPLFNPGGQETYWIALWGVAFPFIAIGVLLTLRRLADADLSSALALLFFVPFANLLFFLAMAAIPGADPDGLRKAAGETAAPPPPTAEGKMARAIFIGGVAGGVIHLGAMAISVYALKAYGTGLFIGAPIIAGFLSARIYMSLHRTSLPGALASAAIGLTIACSAMIVFALEGMICLMMAAPIVTTAGLLGAWMAWILARAMGTAEQLPVAPAAVLLPLLLGMEAVFPMPEREAMPVVTVVEVDAPPQVVFRHVIAFDPLDEPEHWLFRAGVAAPTGATIIGEGVGAIRRCKFTTGVFIEPITVWKPGVELAFGVDAQPEPLEELTLWPGPHPPHLDGYLLVERGQFKMEPLPGGRTRLTGTTWYQSRVFPRAYWRLWSDYVIHQIHRRVLRHIGERAAADTRR